MTIYDIKNTSTPKLVKAHINITEQITPIFNTQCVINPQTGGLTINLSKDSQNTMNKDQTFITKLGAKGSKSLKEHARKCTYIGFDSRNSNKLIAMLIQENATDSRIIIFDWINIKIKASVVFPG
jgi:hypothetical protein